MYDYFPIVIIGFDSSFPRNFEEPKKKIRNTHFESDHIKH